MPCQVAPITPPQVINYGQISENPYITQTKLNHLFATVPEYQPVRMAEVLASSGYSAKLENVHIQANWPQSTPVDFSGCEFKNVDFSGVYNNVTFSGKLENCKFINAELNYSHFVNAKMHHNTFLNAKLNHVTFDHNDIDNMLMLGNKIQLSTMTNNVMNRSIIADTDLAHVMQANNTHTNTAIISQKKLTTFDQDGTSVQGLIEGTKIAVIALGGWASQAQFAVKTYGAHIRAIDPYDLGNEFISAINQATRVSLSKFETLSEPMISAAQFVLQSKDEAILKLKAFAKETIEKVDGLWIPGDGNHIPKAFYKQESLPEFETVTREITEFALIQEALLQNKPIMGVCHGAQMLNVYLGGTLKDVGGQWDHQDLTVLKDAGLLGDVVKNGIVGESMHSQAMDKVVDGFEVVLKYGEVVKGCQAKDGSPVLATQFHPEYLSSNANANIVKAFVKSADKTQILGNAIKLADVLDMDRSVVDTLKVKYTDNQLEYVVDTNSNHDNLLGNEGLESTSYAASMVDHLQQQYGLWTDSVFGA